MSPCARRRSQVWRDPPRTKHGSFAIACMACGSGPWCAGVVSAVVVGVSSFKCRGKASGPRATARPLIFCECLMALMLVAGLAAHWRVSDCIESLLDGLARLEKHFENASELALTWHEDVREATRLSSTLATSCTSSVSGEVVQCMKDLEKSGREVLKLVDVFDTMAAFLRGLSRRVQVCSYFLQSLLSLPLFLAAVVCAVVVAYTACVLGNDGRWRDRCAGICMRCSGVIAVVPAILCAALAGWALLSVDVAASSFCRAPDRSALACIKLVDSDLPYLVSSPYIQGTDLGRAVHSFSHAHARIVSLRVRIKAQCTENWIIHSLESTLSRMEGVMRDIFSAIDAEDVRSQYELTVHDVICGWVALELARLSAWHTAVGVIFLPALALTARRFFARRRPLPADASLATTGTEMSPLSRSIVWATP